MRSSSEIIVRKDYTRGPSTIFYKDSPFWQTFLAICFVALLSFAGLGEWKTLNNLLGGLPKAITVGIIVMAAGYAIIYPDRRRIRDVLTPTAMFLSLIAALFLWSVVIWIMSFMNLSSMIRGCSKLVFQTISILTAVSGVYLFHEKAVDLFTTSLCIANSAIMLLEIPHFGLAASIRSLVTCLVTFGDAEGYARNLEIHDLTFVFGQLILYYAVFAPHGTRQEKKRQRRYLFACIFFFLVGMKRIAIPAVILFVLVGLFFRARKMPKWFYPMIGAAWTIFFLVFIYFIRAGFVTQLLDWFGIDMMGRDYLWSLASDYYEFSITYIGRGFEYVDSIVQSWYKAGLINHPYPFHNDILKVFVEMGFPGLLLWAGIQYIATPAFLLHYADEWTTLLYMCDLSYMTVTYLTDNTSFYFWSTMALRMIPLACAVERKKPPKTQVWKPRNKQEMQDRIRILMQESQQ